MNERVAGEAVRGCPTIPVAVASSQFSAFVILYAVAFLVETAEHWRNPLINIGWLVFVTLLLIRINRVTMFVMLLTSTAYLLVTAFPEVANHVNLMLFANIGIMAGILYSWAHPAVASSDDEWFDWFAPVLRVLLILLFALAGFHKLNADFINPAVSCASLVSTWSFNTLWQPLPAMDIPVGKVLAGVLLLALLALWHERRHDFRIPQVDWEAFRAPIIAMAVIATLLLTFRGADNITSLGMALMFIVLVFVLSWQLVEGPMLLHPRYQWVALCASLLVHVVLALARVTDFQAIAVALLFTFLPRPIWNRLARRQTIGIGGAGVTRFQIYFLMNSWVLMGAWLALLSAGLPTTQMYALTGVLFNVSLLILLWPIVSELFSRNRQWRWDGVRPFHGRTPKILFLVPVAMLAWGLTSYLGLRTAGNFSMFSNLRTEQGGWNHLVLSGPIATLATHQQDLVHIHSIGELPPGLHQSREPLTGMKLPLIEFRKMMYRLGQMDQPVPATISFEGRNWTSADIARHPDWAVDRRDLVMYLSDFRPVQVNPSPNMCRW
jgi:hypothetical protein